MEIPILNTDGSTSSVLWNSANVFDRDGKIIATIAQGVDITEQKKALDHIRWLASFPELNPNPVVERMCTWGDYICQCHYQENSFGPWAA